MASSGKSSRVALVRTEVSEELSASLIRVTRIGELGTTLHVTSNRRTLRNSVVRRTRERNKNVLWSTGRPVRAADNLDFIYERTVYTVRDLKHLTILQVSSACYGKSFTSLFVGDARTSQETHASTACNGYSFIFLFVGDVRTSQDTYYRYLRPVTEIDLLLFMQNMSVPHTKHLRASTASYGDCFSFYI
jgi:hypothetical protein